MYIDTHCHLDDEIFTDRENLVKEYLREGVERVINVGCEEKTSLFAKQLAEQFGSVYFAVGFHPGEISKFNDSSESFIRHLANHEKCVAIGEIGLDYHWEGYDKAVQQSAFIKQLEIACDLKLPVSVHLRDATEDALKVLKENKSKLIHGGVIHCFSGSKETASELLKLGFYIGFGGTLTFKNAVNLAEVAKFVPIDRVLTETDSPYLAPHPLRGSVNSPKNIPIVCAKIAELKGIEICKTAERIMQNARVLFKKLK